MIRRGWRTGVAARWVGRREEPGRAARTALAVVWLALSGTLLSCATQPARPAPPSAKTPTLSSATPPAATSASIAVQARPPCPIGSYDAHPELPSPANDPMMQTAAGLTVAQAKTGLRHPSRFTRARTLDLLAGSRRDLPALLAVLEQALVAEPSPYVRSEGARVRAQLRIVAGLAKREGWSWRRSYAGFWDAHPEPLAAIVRPLEGRPVAIPETVHRATNRDGCFDFPGVAEATLATSHGRLVGGDRGEFGCIAVLFDPVQGPLTLQICGQVFFEMGNHLYGIYHSGHVGTLEVLHRATRQPDGSYTFAAVLLPDVPRGAYALADGTLLIDTGEAAVHVDEEGIASVRPRNAVNGLPAGTTEGPFVR